MNPKNISSAILFLLGLLNTLMLSVNVEAQASRKVQIAFTSQRDGNLEIYVMDADGRHVRNLTNHFSWDAYPVWSPDGRRIVFASRRNGVLADLYVMDADGKNVRQLTDFPGDATEPAWSPDGQKIAFSSSHPDIGAIDIYVMNADGTDIRNLTNHPASDWAPDWSPDSRKIAFTSSRVENTGIFVIDADGKNLRQLGVRVGHEPSWSPDGQRIAFRSGWEDNNWIWDIGIMDADGGNPRRLTRGRFRNEDPSWSPNGQRIAFMGHRDDMNNDVEIYVIDVNGENLRNLTGDAGWDGTPSWFDPAFARMVAPVGELFVTWGWLKRLNPQK